jgi:hypothetical protein
MALFMKLLQVDPDSFTTASVFAMEIRDNIAELKSLNLTLNGNSIVGLILQMNLHNGPVKEEFVCQVKQNMYTNPLHKTPRFDELLKVIYACKRQISFNNPNPTISSVIPSPSSCRLRCF